MTTQSEVDTSVLTVGSLLDFFAPKLEEPRWPPDIFVLVAILLHKSGAYTKVIDAWPPGVPLTASDRRAQASIWAELMRDVGVRWRAVAPEASEAALPPEVITWWDVVHRHRHVPVSEIAAIQELWQALLELCAAADEASSGAGIPTPPEDDGSTADDPFDRRATELLLKSHSLGLEVAPSRISVLPKLHTPQNGMTIRSLSHNLAMCLTGDVNAKWYRLPARGLERSLNLLLIPWPKRIQPRQFRQVDGDLANMPDRYGFFGYEPPSAVEAVKMIESLYANAEAVVGEGEIDAVIFPELSLDQPTYETVRQHIAYAHKTLLIAGVSGREPASNYLAMDVPMANGRVISVGPQHKHHRWRLEKSQILQYGLGSALDPTRFLWENISIKQRELSFVSLRPWLTLSTLICEDLARQDPVAEILRSVAPNLIIALLMDGPQLVSRWSARYATVFADDPGSSVLTLTSLGMATLCRPRGCPTSRCIALWKDARSGGPVEIELPEDADAVVLSLSAELHPEWTADGRRDRPELSKGRRNRGSKGYPILAGVYPVAGR